jgi:hypothetical protein
VFYLKGGLLLYEVLVDLPIHIPLGETYRYMGYPPNHTDIPKMVTDMVEEEIAAAVSIITPKATYLTSEYNPIQHVVYYKEGNLHINGDSIQLHLAQCTKATLFTCTIGGAIETYIDTYFKSGELTRAIILDAIGSAAVEYVADTLNQYLIAAAYRQNSGMVSRFSPGYGDWDLSIQRELVDTAGGTAIGIHVTPTSLLVPRKSVTGIIGWIPGGIDYVNISKSPCEICHMPRCKNPICKGGKLT